MIKFGRSIFLYSSTCIFFSSFAQENSNIFTESLPSWASSIPDNESTILAYVIYDEKIVGSTEIEIIDDMIMINNPKKLVALLNYEKPEILENYINKRKFSTNTGSICKIDDFKICIYPNINEQYMINFAYNKNKLHLHVLTKNKSENKNGKYQTIPFTQKKLSVRNSLFLNSSIAYNHQNYQILAPSSFILDGAISKNNINILYNTSLSKNFDNNTKKKGPTYILNQLELNSYNNDILTKSGLLSSNGSFFLKDSNFYGVSILKNPDSIRGKYGKIRNVFAIPLTQESIVEIYNNNALITSQSHPPGVLYIDNNQLPGFVSGYLTIKIKNIDGIIINEYKKFFANNVNMPSNLYDYFIVDFGLLTNKKYHFTPSKLSPYFNALYNMRIFDHYGISYELDYYSTPTFGLGFSMPFEINKVLGYGLLQPMAILTGSGLYGVGFNFNFLKLNIMGRNYNRIPDFSDGPFQKKSFIRSSYSYNILPNLSLNKNIDYILKDKESNKYLNFNFELNYRPNKYVKLTSSVSKDNKIGYGINFSITLNQLSIDRHRFSLNLNQEITKQKYNTTLTPTYNYNINDKSLLSQSFNITRDNDLQRDITSTTKYQSSGDLYNNDLSLNLSKKSINLNINSFTNIYFNLDTMIFSSKNIKNGIVFNLPNTDRDMDYIFSSSDESPILLSNTNDHVAANNSPYKNFTFELSLLDPDYIAVIENYSPKNFQLPNQIHIYNPKLYKIIEGKFLFVNALGNAHIFDNISLIGNCEICYFYPNKKNIYDILYSPKYHSKAIAEIDGKSYIINLNKVKKYDGKIKVVEVVLEQSLRR